MAPGSRPAHAAQQSRSRGRREPRRADRLRRHRTGGARLAVVSRHRGYEDYEFWLRLAGNGHGVEFLPEFVGRRHAESVPRRPVDVETAPLMNELRELYPLLPWGQS